METAMRSSAPVRFETGDEMITMSPFEVVSDTRGYFAANTMSGTRLNTKLEDLASSITVITKEQMSDFALLDMNDVFLYAGNTEGTGTYTEFVIDDGQGALTDATSGDPGNANRVRGIGKANVSVGNFESSNRVPLDPVDADAVEVSRGPNANIFGLGNASGTVNIVGASANVRRNRAGISFRVDSFDGYRASLDVNRVILKDVLAMRVSTVQQRDGYDLKPSGAGSPSRRSSASSAKTRNASSATF
jgi:outer membrane receptor for ferric coprogen and ferric-rhodotorulic acid